MTRRNPLLLLLAVALACGGEDGPTDEPRPGELVAALNTPNNQDGALLLRVVGPVSAVTPVGGHRVSSATSGATTRVVLTGNITDGDILRLTVPDTRNLTSYTVLVEQVAARDTYALLEPGGYSIALRVK
ncbi:MAG TPA: hypothetical protein VGA78_17285 [Gemmatimonadales bacterium]